MDDDEEEETDWDCLVNSLGIGDTKDIDEVEAVETIMDTRLQTNGARQDKMLNSVRNIRLMRMILLYEDKNAMLITEWVTIAWVKSCSKS